MAYWDSIRPLPLLYEEARDYKKKDSLEMVRKDPRYLDSLDKKRNKLKISGILFTGQSFSRQKRKESISFPSLLSTFNYNTVEGGVINFSPNYRRRFDGDGEGRKFLFINPDIRYGFANTHLNPSITAGYNFGRKYIHSAGISAGRKVFQYNNAGAISERLNTLYTLQAEANYLKIYEADFLRLSYGTGFGGGINLNVNFQFQNRHALNNLPDLTRWKDVPNREFTPNYPTDLVTAPMPDNKAAMLTVGITWRPGADYIELPDRKISLGSKYPTINASVTKGIYGLFASDVDYTKWNLNINDDLDLKLAGQFNYNISVGGFFDAARTFIPDYQHYIGNQTMFATPALSSFQLAPYYGYSNTAALQVAAHAEYHLNGLISNKIPIVRKLNWFFVVGANTLHTNQGLHYSEVVFGIENILKVIRVEYVQGFENNGGRPSGFRVKVPFF